MKKTVFILIAGIVGGVSCEDKKRCSERWYEHSILSYVELKPGAQLKIDNLGSIPFWKGNSSSSSDGYQSQFESCIVYPNGPANAVPDFLYPGPVLRQATGVDAGLPTYGVIFNQARYDELCRDHKDYIHEKWCYTDGGSSGPQPDPSSPRLYRSVLLNRLDSLKIVCVDKPFANRPVGTSLNDLFTLSGAVASLQLTRLSTPHSLDTRKPPTSFTVRLDQFYQQTGGLRFLSVVDSWGFLKGMNRSFTYNRAPRIHLRQGTDVPADSGPYTFKLYLDGGALTVESSEIKMDQASNLLEYYIPPKTLP